MYLVLDCDHKDSIYPYPKHLKLDTLHFDDLLEK